MRPAVVALPAVLTAAVLSAAALTAAVPAAAASGSGGTPAVPPAAADGTGPVVEVTGPVTPVRGIVADVVPRTGSIDGALVSEGSSEFTLASDVYFAFDSAALEPRATEDLQQVAEAVQEAGVNELLVVGHTDSVGDDAYNQTLSEARATAVRDVLTSLLPGATVLAEGRGESEPVAEETRDGAPSPEGQALNRRVTVAPAGRAGDA